MQSKDAHPFIVSGRVTNAAGLRPGVTVRVFLESPTSQGQPLGALVTTDASGRYVVEIPAEEMLRGEQGQPPVVFARAFEGQWAIGESEHQRVHARSLVRDVRVEEESDEPWLFVHGVVRDAYGDVLDGVTVEAFDRDLRHEQPLGRAVTTCGRYAIRYHRSQFRRSEKDAADLVLKICDARGKELHKTPVLFDAPDDCKLDVTLSGAKYEGPSEWERLTDTLTPLLEGVAPRDLREDDRYQDFTFLAGETRLDRRTLYIWVVCHRLAERPDNEKVLSPDVFFAFLRQGQPSLAYATLREDLQDTERVHLLEETLLRELSELIPDRQTALLRSAIASNLVPARIARSIAEILRALQNLRSRYTADSRVGGGKGTVGQLLELTPVEPWGRTVFLERFATHTGTLGTFWKKLEEDQVLRPEVVRQIKLAFELGALTRNHVPLVGELTRRFQRGEIKAKRELARYTRADWKAVFEHPGPHGGTIGVPANIDGDTPDARNEEFAAILESQFERAYPTTSFAARLGRAPQSPVPARTEMVRFLDANPRFHLDRYRIDHYVAENPESVRDVRDKAALVDGLKAVQRVFKLGPTHAVVDALIARKIDSAQQIYFMGSGQFLRLMSDSGVNSIEAKKLYRKAESSYALALTMFGNFNFGLNGPSPYGVPSQTPDAATQAKIDALPNVQTLFGSLDYCECTHCRSVYSPSAHFVDTLRFLGERWTNGTGVNASKNVRQVLLERRPDLGEIELSCENTNTPLPYVDLANEILEDAVAPPTPVTLGNAIQPDLVAGTIRASVVAELTAQKVPVAVDAHVYAPDARGHWAVRDAERSYRIFSSGGSLQLLPTRQTSLSAAELRANPQHTNTQAYDKLRQEVFPLHLPFDLWHLQARTYLEHLGVPQPRLLELFQQELADGVTLQPTSLQIDAAWLGITETERQILTGSQPGKKSWDYWGLAENGNDVPDPENPADPTANVTGTWLQVLANVHVMLNRSGLQYKELLQLLDMKYVNADGSVHVQDSADSNAASCDTSRFSLQNLTPDVLDRMHRFVRLWRRVGCAMWELDLILPDVDPDPNVVDKRITDAVLADLSKARRLKTRLGLDWRELHSLWRGIDDAPYVDRLNDAAPVQTLYQRLFRNKLVDAVASFPATPEALAGAIADRVPGILAAFRIQETDLDLILEALSLTPADTLDASRLSGIHRIASLARALDLGVDAFLRLRRLWGGDPFADPAATLAFVELAARVASSAFSVPELDYLLAHRFTPTSGLALDDKAVVGFLQGLRESLQKIHDDVRKKADQSQEDYVRSKLGQLPALDDDADESAALRIVDGTWTGTPAARNALIDQFFTGVLDPAVAKVQLAAIAGGLAPVQLEAAVAARFAYVQPGLEAFLLAAGTRATIRQKVAELLGVDVPSATALLAGMHLPGQAVALLEALDDPRLLETQADDSYKFALDGTNFPDVFDGLRLMHKASAVIEKLELAADDVTWWLDGTHASDMGWAHPNDFPLDTTSQVDLGEWLALHQFFRWKAGLPPSDTSALELATHVLDAGTTSAANLAELAKLAAWDETDLDALVAAFHWKDTATAFDVVKQELRSADNLVRLSDCMRALRRLGVNAKRALEWARAVPSAADAESLKQTVKAKYDLKQWQDVIAPIQDTFREQKRLALVGWLVAHPNQAKGQSWSDSNGLYNHFLIDVEMCSCMLTSRLKQAAASAQLFVQRCLLNLEKDILAKTDLDPKWKQWKWMNRYRVWEANRKVFLYPENWIEPELRDEKSPFFKTLENELQQNDVTQETAEQAFLNYLESLDKVANLEIRAMTDQVISSNESVLHVFGRSRTGVGAEHYYRKRINGARWTPWEKVDPEITGDHLVAGIYNRRLCLLWPQFVTKTVEPDKLDTPNIGQTGTVVPKPIHYWEIKLYWTELKKGRWTPKVLADATHQVYYASAGGNNPHNLQFRARLKPWVQVRMYDSPDPQRWAPSSAELFDKIGRQITTDGLPEDVYDNLIAPPESRFHNNLIQHTTPSLYFWHSSKEFDSWGDYVDAHSDAKSIRLLQAADPYRTYTVIDAQADAFQNEGSFFVVDRNRSYFVDYVWRTNWFYTPSGNKTSQRISTFRFFPHYHPYVDLFIKELNVWGIKGLLNRRIQVDPASLPGAPTPYDFKEYQPDLTNVVEPLPVEDVDFDYLGAYSPYNWELFFHAPFLIANKLAANQRFEEALEWFHYIFDPTSTDTATPNPDTPQQKYWITKPFYETTKADYYQQKIENILLAIAKGDAALQAQVDEWRDHPFNPHLIARMRTVAYQKNVLIKYVQTLIAWGDQLFRQDTMESNNEATQLYVLAASILGPRPKSIPKAVPNPIKTFYQLQAEGIDGFGNSLLKDVENLLPPAPPAGPGDADAPDLPRLDVLYFCIPHNDKLLGLWDTVEDRLFKLRHCLNIEGVFRQLPLFEPPIDPAMLVRAAAAGLDIGAALSEASAPLPLYRFTFMVQRAIELCNDVKALGAALLAALEKRDAEALALLRSTHEQTMLQQVRLVRVSQIDEALRQKEAFDEARKVAEERKKHYEKLISKGLSPWEITSLSLTGGAIVAEIVATVLGAIGGGTSVIPQFKAGINGFGGSPAVKVEFGGKQVTSALTKASDVTRSVANILQMGSGMTATIAGHNRRAEDWDFQKRLAEKELPQIDKQIAAADLRRAIAEQELANQDKLIENAQKEAEHLLTKFTNQELYDWTITQIATVYFQSYQLAYDVAKRAERSFRYELGLSESAYVQFGYWDSLKKGLLSGDRLHYDLKRMESAWYERNKREYELTKHVSLAQLDPVALLKLRQNGECFMEIPETAFDVDYPGHYFRRLRSVSVSIPCTAGPYTTIACTLTLTSNRLRKDPNLLAGKYERDAATDDPRFQDELAAIQSIATSNAKSDGGLFQLEFRDERYLPFEGAGAISSWHVKLNKDFPQFDFSSIADVVFHVSYTAREGGELLKSKAVDELGKKLEAMALAEGRKGLYRVFDLKREYPDAWYRFLHPANAADDQAIALDDLLDRLPFFTKKFATKKARQIEVVARMKDGATYQVQLSPPLGVAPADLLPLAPDPTYKGFHRAFKDLTGSEVPLGPWTLKLRSDNAANFRSLPADAVSELFLVVHYLVA